MDYDLQGNIEKFTLTEIFQLIALGKKSGTLGIQRDESIVMIYFQSGDITYGYGPRQTYHVGQLLKDLGKLTPNQLDEAVSIQAKTENSKRLGEILIERRFIDRADLETVVKKQVEDLIYSLLAWETGSFKFYENQFPTDEEITVRLSAENVILEGLRRLDEAAFIAQTLPDLDTVYTISAAQSGRARSVTMAADEWNLMALVNGQRSLSTVIEMSSIPRENALRLLAQLKMAGLIVTTGKKASEMTPSAQSHTSGRPNEIPTMVNRLAGLFEAYLSEKPSTKMQTTVNRISTLEEKQ